MGGEGKEGREEAAFANLFKSIPMVGSETDGNTRTSYQITR